MFKIRKISPMFRAVGTVGAVAAIAGGITFAQLTSNTVAQTNDTLDSATAHLLIGIDNGSGCDGATDGPQQGLQVTGLESGQTSDPFLFCLHNSGSADLNITTGIPTVFTGTIPASDVTLAMTCGDGGSSSGTLDQYTGGTPIGTLPAGDSTDCQATVTLSASYNGSGGSVTPFEIDFVGTQPE